MRRQAPLKGEEAAGSSCNGPWALRNCGAGCPGGEPRSGPCPTRPTGACRSCGCCGPDRGSGLVAHSGGEAGRVVTGPGARGPDLSAPHAELGLHGYGADLHPGLVHPVRPGDRSALGLRRTGQVPAVQRVSADVVVRPAAAALHRVGAQESALARGVEPDAHEDRPGRGFGGALITNCPDTRNGCCRSHRSRSPGPRRRVRWPFSRGESAEVVVDPTLGVLVALGLALTWDHVFLKGRPDLDPPQPPHIAVWRSVRRTGGTKTRKSRRTLALPARCVEALWQQFEDQGWDRLAADEKRNTDSSSPRLSASRSTRPTSAAPSVRRSRTSTGSTPTSGRLGSSGTASCHCSPTGASRWKRSRGSSGTPGRLSLRRSTVSRSGL